MSIFYTLFAFILALLVLIVVHEFGHFWVARKCGVKVLRFAIGLGAPLWSKHGKDGTEYALAPFPVGGYVKMLDEREGNVSAEELHLAFNRQSLLKRVVIVVAGPIANFILALFLFWIIAMLGTNTLRPVIGKVQPQSLAERAGFAPNHEIISLNNKKMQSWEDVSHALIGKIGTSDVLTFELLDVQTSSVSTHFVQLNNWLYGTFEPSLLQELGIEPWQPLIPVILDSLEPNAPAGLAGLQVGDKITMVNGVVVEDWFQFVELIRPMFGQQVDFEVERTGAKFKKSVILGVRELEGQQVSYLGARVRNVQFPPEMLRQIRYNPISAAIKAVDKVYSLSILTVQGLAKMITGALSAKNLSGPITIAKMAGSTAQVGFSAFLYFLAYLSISLGVLNLLPIPVLDGGHLLFYIMEAVRGKPLSERTEGFVSSVGMFLIAGLIFMAIFNDLSRLVS